MIDVSKIKGEVEIWEGDYNTGVLLERIRNTVAIDGKYNLLKMLSRGYGGYVDIGPGSLPTCGRPPGFMNFRATPGPTWKNVAIRKIIMEPSNDTVRFLGTIHSGDLNGLDVDQIYLGGMDPASYQDSVELLLQYTGLSGGIPLSTYIPNIDVISMTGQTFVANDSAHTTYPYLYVPSRDFDPEDYESQPEEAGNFSIQKDSLNAWWLQIRGGGGGLTPQNPSWCRIECQGMRGNVAPTLPFATASLSSPIHKTSAYKLTVSWSWAVV